MSRRSSPLCSPVGFGTNCASSIIQASLGTRRARPRRWGRLGPHLLGGWRDAHRLATRLRHCQLSTVALQMCRRSAGARPSDGHTEARRPARHAAFGTFLALGAACGGGARAAESLQSGHRAGVAGGLASPEGSPLKQGPPPRCGQRQLPETVEFEPGRLFARGAAAAVEAQARNDVVARTLGSRSTSTLVYACPCVAGGFWSLAPQRRRPPLGEWALRRGVA